MKLGNGFSKIFICLSFSHNIKTGILLLQPGKGAKKLRCRFPKHAEIIYFIHIRGQNSVNSKYRRISVLQVCHIIAFLLGNDHRLFFQLLLNPAQMQEFQGTGAIACIFHLTDDHGKQAFPAGKINGTVKNRLPEQPSCLSLIKFMGNSGAFPLHKEIMAGDFLRASVKRLSSVKYADFRRQRTDQPFRALIPVSIDQKGNIIFLKIQILCHSKKCPGGFIVRKIPCIHQDPGTSIALTADTVLPCFPMKNNICKAAAHITVILRTCPFRFPFVNLPVRLHGFFQVS